ncbi:hypothetical protein D0962_09580 [Leptolyngbyaceae cyanobacterium CCMR0082]|uniref:Uncharacterized protein n=1 Tax=Adonisia turfae CCMR0082 TaxID=2304604 RepID=A0A6M0S3N4_9CYAN|nr:hypothetical protein [Adonisia turfae CCMR0082]
MYLLHSISLRPYDQPYSYGRRAQAVTYLPHQSQLAACESLFELTCYAHDLQGAYPHVFSHLQIEGSAVAQKQGVVFNLKSRYG